MASPSATENNTSKHDKEYAVIPNLQQKPVL